jgi:hypothetical protein
VANKSRQSPSKVLGHRGSAGAFREVRSFRVRNGETTCFAIAGVTKRYLDGAVFGFVDDGFVVVSTKDNLITGTSVDSSVNRIDSDTQKIR